MTVLAEEDKRTNVIWEPQPVQLLQLQSKAFELLVGGARGGGKTDFLINDFLNGVEYGKDYHGLLVRTTMDETGNLLERMEEIFPGLQAKFSKNTWTFPDYKVLRETGDWIAGSTLLISSIYRDRDVKKFRGRQFQWIAWDDGGDRPNPAPWFFLMTCCRSAASVPCYMRMSVNPGGEGHAWLKARFIDGKEPGKVYRDPETGLTQQFIPSTLEDNPKLIDNDPEYPNRLKNLPSHLYKAHRWGSWDVYVGQAFDEWDINKHVCKPFTINPDWLRFCTLDWGYVKPFSVGWWAVTPEGRLIRYREWYGNDPKKWNTGLRMKAEDVARKTFEMSAGEGVEKIIVDSAIFSNIDGGKTTGEKFEDVWGRGNVIKSKKDRAGATQQMHDMLKSELEDGRPMIISFSTCYNYIRCIPQMIVDDKDPEKVMHVEDHLWDEVHYCLTSAFIHKPDYYAKKQRQIRQGLSLGTRVKRYKDWEPDW